MYEYKNVTVPIEVKFSTPKGDNFKKCMEEVQKQAKDGWRLVQICEPSTFTFEYEIIFEKKIEG